jgi:hypothetical protein
VAGLIVAVGIRNNTFALWGSDPAGYVEAARRWADGQLVSPLPIQFWATWMPHEYALTPFGFRLGTVRGTEVGTYPLGLPVLMAAAMRVGGALAAHLVAPLCAGLLVWCTYVLASWLAGRWAGLLAAVLLATSPATVALGVQPMSDVPAAALWALAWVMSLRPGLGASAASGAAVAAATMVRPNLAPLGLIVLLLVARTWREGDDTRWRRIALFLVVAAIGPAVLAWSQAELYGSPFRPGYVTAETYFSVANIRHNAAHYPRILIVLHTPLVLLGLAATALLLWPRVRATLDLRAQAVVISATAFVAITYALYLPYMQFQDLLSLRFMLPAMVALFILLAGVLARLSLAVRSRSRVLAVLALVPAVIVAAYPAGALRYALNLHKEQTGLIFGGHYLREVLPANAAVFTGGHGGGLAHYTGRLIIRLDPIAPHSLDAVVDEVRRHGYRPVLVLDAAGEASFFQTRFATSQFHSLDWPPRAEFGDVVRFRYWDFADRDSYRQGQRWPVDVISSRR